MASLSSWKCLLRPSISSTSYAISSSSTRLPALASLSTSAALNYPPKPAAVGKKAVAGKPKSAKAGKTLKIKKKAFVKTGRPPAPGERKAARKRIVLSNTNALEVAGMVDMTPEALLDVEQVGKVLGLPGPVVDQLRAVEAFRTTQGWGLFRRPGMLIREESIKIAQIMRDAKATGETAVYVIDGARSTGKSLMVLQALAAAFIDKWIVVSIPEGKQLSAYQLTAFTNIGHVAQELTNANTDYSLIPDTKLYSQNAYAAKWLGEIIKANDAILSKLTISQKHELPIPIKDNITVSQLAELGAKEVEIAWPIFQAVWTEVTAKGRPPVLMTVDGLQHIMDHSDYRNPEFELIHAHDLAAVKLFVDYLSGSRKLTNGGAVFAATSQSNTKHSYAIDMAIQKKSDRMYRKLLTPIDPYKKMDVRAWDTLQNARLLKLKGLSKEEARGLMEYWAASGVLRQRVDEKTVTEKWAVAGNGVVGEIQRNALWMRI